MSDKVYHKLANRLSSIGVGFPETENGIEIKLLKKIFTPEEAKIFRGLFHHTRSLEEVAKRLDMPAKDLQDKLFAMVQKDQIQHYDVDGKHFFEYTYWIKELFEDQLKHQDQEFAAMYEEYKPLLDETPSHWMTLPIEEEIDNSQEALPYEKATAILDANKSFALIPCVCKEDKEKLGSPCKRSEKKVCLTIFPGNFSIRKLVGQYVMPGIDATPISRDEAKAHLKKAHELGLVNLTHNYRDGRFFICSCCDCCCNILAGINQLEMPATIVINSGYYSVIDTDKCVSCGTCADERCQVKAIEMIDSDYTVLKNKCIGCGVCGYTCPEDAISLIRKSEDEISKPVEDYNALAELRGDDRWIKIPGL